MIQRFAGFFEGRSKRLLGTWAIAITTILGLIDLKTGAEIHFLLFYLAPIFIGSWFVSKEMGIYIACFVSLICFVTDSLLGRSYSADWISYSDLLLRSVGFIVFAIGLARLRAKFDELSQLAARDFLTGLPNGHAFYQLTAKEMDRAFGLEPMTLACIDVSGLQGVNDNFGYPAGDQMLCTIAHTIRQHVPRPDLVGRIAGTSFAALLPNTASEDASLVLEQLRHFLQEERQKNAQPLTFYISAVACSKAPRKLAELMHQAESQMNRMKGGEIDSIQIVKVDELPALN